MNLFDRRRVWWDYLGGALWVLPTVSAPLFLTAKAMLSRVSVDADSPLWPLAFQGTVEDAHGILVVEAVEPTEQPRWAPIAPNSLAIDPTARMPPIYFRWCAGKPGRRRLTCYPRSRPCRRKRTGFS